MQQYLKDEMQVRIYAQRLVNKAKTFDSPILVKEYHRLIDFCRHYYGICPNDFDLFQRLPADLQRYIEEEELQRVKENS